MGDEGDAARRGPRRKLGLVYYDFDRPGRPFEQQAFLRGHGYTFRRSTTRPFLRCSSTISSMSALST